MPSVAVNFRNRKSMISKKALLNHLTWSPARFATLQQCERRYYYAYIESWGGWSRSATPQQQAAYHSKYLTESNAEIGLLVHDRIEGIIRDAIRGRRYASSTEINVASTLLTNFFTVSAERKLQDVTRTDRKLLRDVLAQCLSFEEKAILRDRLRHLLASFFKLAEAAVILEKPEIVLPEFLDRGDFKIGFELGIPARPRTDIVWRGNEGLVIGDWKCGRPSLSHREQALTYDIYVRRRLCLPDSYPVESRFIYLTTSEVLRYSFSLEEREEHLWKIGEEFETLLSFSDDPQINVGPIDRFRPKLGAACNSCPFQGICPEGSKFLGAQPKGKETV